jgi:hypothetical protein
MPSIQTLTVEKAVFTRDEFWKKHDAGEFKK